MPNPYRPGQEVRLRAEGHDLSGTIRDLSLSTAVVAFRVPFDVPAAATISWPDGAASPVDLGRLDAAAELVVRVAIPRYETQAVEAGVNRPDDRPDLRRTLRVDMAVPVRLADPRVTAALASGQTLNLSAGGAQVLTDLPLVVGREYICQLDLLGETLLVKAKPIRRMGHNSYALRFLTTPEIGHRLMRRLFAMMRTGTAPLKRPHLNFRKS